MTTTSSVAGKAAISDRQRRAYMGLLAGLVSGVANAVLARILMRIVAIAASGQGSFSVGGTMVIFLFGLLVGPLFGLWYAAMWPRLPGPTWTKGLSFGLILVVVLQIPGLFISPDFRAELMVVGPVGFGVFGLMNLAFVLSLAYAYRWQEVRWPDDESRDDTVRNGIWPLRIVAILGGLFLAAEIIRSLLGLV